ncbi:putative O-glycosylation ligase, exosortase A system-associated [Photobacterium lutimaris]|uniref:Putative O-glycosylation ligase, exosortase A system-associated n=1 Tax=Photobacterium lutimaris TaxID=388278 RepID=A0A2T3J2T5_9GAMM|nr:putative O-glycosylation ligase, exosortase A system-associated [Photobacterium lutimaris]PSU35576.1 putative O-glycosylation ligase, exosortase A system-associated [Photobacterium lutimaris]TDR78627.1 putative O-glycosylation ligase (exosortase A-associated) [Photobacterium lutimaris]
MRDIVFVIFFACLMVFAFRRSYISVSLWLWAGLFVPAYWLYSFAHGISFQTILVVVTVIVYLFDRNKSKFSINFLLFTVLLIYMHFTITTFYSLGIEEKVWLEWQKFSKIMLLMLFIVLIIRSKVHFNYILMVFVLSLGVMGAIEGLKFIASGGSHHIKGPDNNILSDNNHFALALDMVLPLNIYLLSQYKGSKIRPFLLITLVLSILSVLGTASRGGFIGLVCVALYFLLTTKRKALTVIAFAVVAGLASLILTDKWYNRMESIDTAKDDGSFMIRVKSWKMYTLMAMERPLLGAGFRSVEVGYVWRSIAPNFYKLSFIESPEPGEKAWAAHSIYFQVLGDHGFVGLGLFMLILATAFLTLMNIMRKIKDIERLEWQYQLAKMFRVSLVAFSVAGAALSLPYAEIFWALIAIIISLDISVRESLAVIKKEQSCKPKERRIRKSHA